MKRILLILLALTPLLVWGQNISVREFYLDANDLTANAYGTMEYDQNGEVCALIKVETTQKGFRFDGGSIGVTKVDETHVGEVWIYVPHGIRKISIHHAQLGSLRNYEFPVSIESARTYVMKLTTGKVQTIVEEVITQQFVVFRVDPPNALVILDGEPIPVYNGIAQKLVDFGDHSYRIDCSGYHSEIGKVVVNDSRNKIEKVVKLKPKFGWIVLSDPLSIGAAVYIDNVLVGKLPFVSSELQSGEHHILVVHDLYEAFDAKVEVTDGDTAMITPEMIPNFARLRLYIEEDAEIWVNNNYKGKRDITDDFASGSLFIECRKEHYRTVNKTIKVNPSMSGEQILLPSPIPIFGHLAVSSVPTNADVFIDGEKVGDSPIVLNNVLEGEHQIIIKKHGFSDFQKKVVVEEGKTAIVEGKLVNGCLVEFKCNVPKAHLYIDDIIVGYANGTYTLSIGTHRFKCTADGYGDYIDAIFVSGTEKQYRNIEMYPTADDLKGIRATGKSKEPRKNKFKEFFNSVYYDFGAAVGHMLKGSTVDEYGYAESEDGGGFSFSVSASKTIFDDDKFSFGPGLGVSSYGKGWCAPVFLSLAYHDGTGSASYAIGYNCIWWGDLGGKYTSKIYDQLLLTFGRYTGIQVGIEWSIIETFRIIGSIDNPEGKIGRPWFGFRLGLRL